MQLRGDGEGLWVSVVEVVVVVVVVMMMMTTTMMMMMTTTTTTTTMMMMMMMMTTYATFLYIDLLASQPQQHTGPSPPTLRICKHLAWNMLNETNRKWVLKRATAESGTFVYDCAGDWQVDISHFYLGRVEDFNVQVVVSNTR